MRGNKTTAIDPVKKIAKILKKRGVHNISYGIIISIKGRKDHRATVKLSSQTGCHLLTITSKRYKQETRIYDDVDQKTILSILHENLGEQFRIL